MSEEKQPTDTSEDRSAAVFLVGLFALGVAMVVALMWVSPDHSSKPQVAAKPAKSTSTTTTAAASAGPVLSAEAKEGLAMMGKSDCAICHQPDKKLIGPSYRDIAMKYDGDSTAKAMLVKKVQKGGSGNWGAAPMTPHPQLTDAQVGSMVTYVLSLKDAEPDAAGMPVDISTLVTEQELVAKKTVENLFEPEPMAAFWHDVDAQEVSLQAQPMTVPRPKTTKTGMLRVQATHNGNRLAIRLQWADKDYSEAGVLGTFSDAVALQFPLTAGEVPPPIAMGSRAQPVHIVHWRSQFQADREKGHKTMQDIYPNMSVDMYPLEFAYTGNLRKITAHEREVFVVGQAVGNPQSFRKVSGVDEIVAEGFGSSSVIEHVESSAKGLHLNGEWTVVIVRPLKARYASDLTSDNGSFVSFAVWQGGEQEVGSRKSLTLKWMPMRLGE